MNSGENFRRAASSAVRSTFSSNPTFGLSPDWMNPYPPPTTPLLPPLPQSVLRNTPAAEQSNPRLPPNLPVPLSSPPANYCPHSPHTAPLLPNNSALDFH